MTQDLYCLWLMPEGKAFDGLNHLIKGLAKDYGAVEFEPHLTLTTVPVSDLDDPEKALEALVNKSKPLTLKAPQIVTGNLFTQSVYLRFEDSPELKALHALSCKLLGIQQLDFYPHLSLIYKDLGEEIKQEIASEIKISLQNITFDRLEIIRSSPSVTCSADVQYWRVLTTHSLDS